MMGSSIVITFCYPIFLGKVMKLLEFVLLTVVFYLLWIGSVVLLAYHWYDAD